MKYLLKNWEEFLDKNIVVNGWVRIKRKFRGIKFLSINDGTYNESLQAVITQENKEKFSQLLSTIYTGTCVEIKGKVIKSPANGQDIELIVDELKVYGTHEPKRYPLGGKSRMTIENLRQHVQFRCRTPVLGSVFRIKSAISQATHEFMKNQDCLHLEPNVLTINACEGGASVFQVTEKDISDLSKLPVKKESTKYDWKKDHFGKPVFITESKQLQLEALALGLNRVYSVGICGRAEHSLTNKHASMFDMFEAEFCFVDLKYLMNFSELYIKFIIEYVMENNMEDLKNLDSKISPNLIERLSKLKDCEYKEVSYIEAMELLSTKGEFEDAKVGEDLSSDMENWLTEHFEAPVFVTHWPISIKSFYMKQEEEGLCESFDLLMPHRIGEIIGGSMREENYEMLIKMMDMKKVPKDPLKFYTEIRQFGTAPHGGFGLGLDRLCMLVTGMKNIRDVVPFPIAYGECSV